jgi:hypothetical protein
MSKAELVGVGMIALRGETVFTPDTLDRTDA